MIVVHCARGNLKLVAEPKDQPIAGMQAQGGSLTAVLVKVAVAHLAVGIERIAIAEINLKYPILTAKVFRFRDDASGGRTRTDLRGARLSKCTGRGPA
jgi:hypothetical protein